MLVIILKQIVMNMQHCKIGRVRPNVPEVFNLASLEKSYKRFIEDAYNLKFLDASMSDLLYYEASKLKKQLVELKRFTNQQDVVL